MRREVLVALVAGFVVGTFLAALPYAENEACLRFAVEERGGGAGEVGGWPYGTRCEWRDDGSAAASLTPSVPETLAWVFVATLLFAGALLRRSAAARGASLAAIELAFIGWGWHFGGEAAPVGMFVLTFGFLITFAADRGLRRGGSRSASLLTAAILTPTVLFAWMLPAFLGLPYVAIAAGLLTGAAVTALRPFAPDPLPAR